MRGAPAVVGQTGVSIVIRMVHTNMFGPSCSNALTSADTQDLQAVPA